MKDLRIQGGYTAPEGPRPTPPTSGSGVKPPKAISRAEIDRQAREILHKALRTGPHTEFFASSDTPVLIRPSNGRILLQANTYLSPEDALEIAAELHSYAREALQSVPGTR